NVTVAAIRRTPRRIVGRQLSAETVDPWRAPLAGAVVGIITARIVVIMIVASERVGSVGIKLAVRQIWPMQRIEGRGRLAAGTQHHSNSGESHQGSCWHR